MLLEIAARALEAWKARKPLVQDYRLSAGASMAARLARINSATDCDQDDESSAAVLSVVDEWLGKP